MEMHLSGYHNISDENFIFQGLGNGCFDLVREKTLSYTPNGNITDKTDAGEYAYHPTKPNAVTGVSNDNQNISLLTQDITYNALNKASSITEGDYTLQFLYGHDKQRRKTTFYDANGLAMEKYFVGLYEKEIDHQTGVIRHINYITAGDGMTAIVLQEEENGITTEETYFTYKDHLGSIVALTDESGDVVLEQSFDAWGRYRNPDNWTYSNIDESPTWLRGYTGHEHLPHFDLINMNGRIYDPILGRMLSADRFVQDPLFSQSYNRFSYCWNNPLRYTDPSGDIIAFSDFGYSFWKFISPIAFKINFNTGSDGTSFGVDTSIGMPQIIGRFQVGFNLYTGDPGLDNRMVEEINGQKTYVKHGENDPDEYRSGVLYFGFGNLKIGRNSEMVRHAIQNVFAHDIAYALTSGGEKLPHFAIDHSKKPKWYWGFGTGSGNSLW